MTRFFLHSRPGFDASQCEARLIHHGPNGYPGWHQNYQQYGPQAQMYGPQQYPSQYMQQWPQQAMANPWMMQQQAVQQAAWQRQHQPFNPQYANYAAQGIQNYYNQPAYAWQSQQQQFPGYQQFQQTPFMQQGWQQPGQQNYGGYAPYGQPQWPTFQHQWHPLNTPQGVWNAQNTRWTDARYQYAYVPPRPPMGLSAPVSFGPAARPVQRGASWGAIVSHNGQVALQRSDWVVPGPNGRPQYAFEPIFTPSASRGRLRPSAEEERRNLEDLRNGPRTLASIRLPGFNLLEARLTNQPLTVTRWLPARPNEPPSPTETIVIEHEGMNDGGIRARYITDERNGNQVLQLDFTDGHGWSYAVETPVNPMQSVSTRPTVASAVDVAGARRNGVNVGDTFTPDGALDYTSFVSSNDPLIRYLSEEHQRLSQRYANDRSIQYQLQGNLRDGYGSGGRGGYGNLEQGLRRRESLNAVNAALEARLLRVPAGTSAPTEGINVMDMSPSGEILIEYDRPGERRIIRLMPNHLSLYGDYSGHTERYLRDDGIIIRLQYSSDRNWNGRPVVPRVDFTFTQPGTYIISQRSERAGDSRTVVVPDTFRLPDASASRPPSGPGSGELPPEGPELGSLQKSLIEFQSLAKTANEQVALADAAPADQKIEKITLALRAIEAAFKNSRVISQSAAFPRLSDGLSTQFIETRRQLRQAQLRLAQDQLGLLVVRDQEAVKELARMEQELTDLQTLDPSNVTLPKLRTQLGEFRAAIETRQKNMQELRTVIETLRKLSA